MKEEAAIDWFFDKIKSHFEHDGDLYESVVMTYAISKQKFRHQIMKAYDEGNQNQYDKICTSNHVNIDEQEYYNKTYKQHD